MVKRQGSSPDPLAIIHHPSISILSWEAWIALGLALAVLLLYLRTLAPSVLRVFDDSLEFQVVCPTLGIAHPTGYPLYTLLGWLCTLLVPVGDAAYRVNVLSALGGALAAGLTCLAVVAGLRLVGPTGWPARIAGLVAGGTLATSSTFWEYSTVAEVYTLNAAFLAAMVFLLLRWATRRGRTPLLLAALCFGLSLTHHRTMVLLTPVFLLFIATLDWRALLQAPLRRLVAILLPLSLYLYIPWRGLYTTSLDGQYQNTLAGFLQWTLGLYSAWWQRVESPAELGANLAAYRDLLLTDFTLLGVILGLAGFVWLLWRQRPLALLLGLSYASLTTFSLIYRGIGGFPAFFFIAPHVFLAMLIGVGVYALSTGLSHQSPVASRRSQAARRILHRASRIVHPASCTLLLLFPLFLVYANFPVRDVSQDTTARDAGRDIMSQPLEKGAAIVGLLGETTLVRYFQWTQGLRPDLVTVPADSEEVRLAAVAEQLAAGRAVYITRPLPGAAERWHLSSVGPLVRVRPGPVTELPVTQYPAGVQYAPGVRLLGYDLAALNDGTAGPLPVESGQRLRVTLYWYPTRVITDDLLVFVHVLDGVGHRLGQDDAPPVRGCYPTTAWRPGEIVADTHDVRLLPGAPPGVYRLRVGWETPTGRALDVLTGSELVGEFPVCQPARPPVADAQQTIAHPLRVEFGDGLMLLGHDLEPVTVRPGDQLSFATLWQAQTALDKDHDLEVYLSDATGVWRGTREPLSPHYPTSRWSAGQVVRVHVMLTIPPDVRSGSYEVLLSVYDQPAASPLNSTRLQRITVSP